MLSTVFIIRNKKLLHHSLRRPSRSDFVQLEFKEGYFSIKDKIGEMLEQPEARAVIQELFDKASAKSGAGEVLSDKLNDVLSGRLFYTDFDSPKYASHFNSSCFSELFS